jgi:hypothetical protein
VLTEGGARTYAICVACNRSVGSSLTRSWMTVIWWVALPLVLLFAIVLALSWIFPG